MGRIGRIGMIMRLIGTSIGRISLIGISVCIIRIISTMIGRTVSTIMGRICFSGMIMLIRVSTIIGILGLTRIIIGRISKTYS